MAEDLDIDAMLEETFKKSKLEKEPGERSNHNDKDKDRKKRKRSRERRRSHSREKKAKRSEKDRDREKDRGDRDREKDRDKDRGDREKDRDKPSKSREEREKEREEREKEREKERERREKEREKEREERKKKEEIERGRNVAKLDDYYKRRRSSSRGRKREQEPDLTPEERDVRTVFCMQLAARIRPRDLEEFFSSVGKVKDVRLILDNKSHRSKGIAYIEFKDIESVPLAIGLSGQRLLGVPIIVQNAHAERNRQASTNQPASLMLTSSSKQPASEGPGRLYVGSLHPNITEGMLKGIFDPFGKLHELKLVKDLNTGKSAGYGFVTFSAIEDAKKALDQLNGFELAGRSIKVGFVTEKTTETLTFDADEMERAGFNLGATGRLQLMAKLAEGTGLQLPAAAASALSVPQSIAAPPIATQCFMLSNMFDPTKQTSDNWETELRDEVIEECKNHGGVVHVYVDKSSTDGNVYIKCPTVATAAAAVNALHGRYFAGKVITAAYVPLPNYHALFTDALVAQQLLDTSTAR